MATTGTPYSASNPRPLRADALDENPENGGTEETAQVNHLVLDEDEPVDWKFLYEFLCSLDKRVRALEEKLK